MSRPEASPRSNKVPFTVSDATLPSPHGPLDEVIGVRDAVDVRPRDEARNFWQMRRRVVATLVRQTLEGSRLRLIVLSVLSTIFWVGLFVLFAEGFHLLATAIAHEPTRARTVQVIYNVFFASLLAMLSVSAAIIMYGALYRSQEVTFLLTTPARAGRIVLHKFQEAVLFSCWGFVLLGSPLLIAYGLVNESPWYYFLMVPPYMLAFVFVPASLGSIACMLVVFLLPRVRIHAAAVAGVLLLGGAALFGSLAAQGNEHLMTAGWLEDMLGRLRFAEQRLLPSWWLSSGLLEAAHARHAAPDASPWRESVLFLAVLVSNALMGVLLTIACGERLLRAGYSRLAELSSPRRRVSAGLLDRFTMAVAFPLPLPVRLLLVKDIRLFRRDPVQWTQFLIFFGLLALYFMNIHRFQYGDHLQRWMQMIGFLNLGVVGLILSTYTTRFIYPLISLEGRRFWILGSLPVSRDTILWAKLLLAVGGSIIPCSSLILLSDTMLGIAAAQPAIALVHQITCWILCIGLSAIAVGLGARLPNLREPSPSKIAAGFGGTLNLILSGALIVTVVLATSVPSYFYLEQGDATSGVLPMDDWMILRLLGIGSWRGVVIGQGFALLVGAIATVVPLWIGIRSFRKLEF